MKKLTIEFVKEQFEKDNWILKSTEYVNNYTKLDCVCPNEHECNICWNNWKHGKRCPICAGLVKKTIEFVRSELEKEHWILKSAEYIDAHRKLDCICPKGHECFITWNSWHQGHRCSICYNKYKCGSTIRLSIDFIRSDFVKRDYTLLTKNYKNNQQKLEYICPNGHHRSITWANWLQGQRCSTCEDLSKCGAGNSNWKGGISCEPYCEIWLDKEYKEDIKARDNYQCQNPSCNSNCKGDLCGHHIDYNKKNCDPWNLITLCRSCNGRANTNRQYWINLYQGIMTKKYGYKYGEA